MKVSPPPSPKELEDINAAIRHNIPEAEYLSNEVWFGLWAQHLIGLRRAYNKRWLSNSYNEHSSDA
jgi:hypothetical protein